MQHGRVSDLLVWAYGVKDVQVVGLPDWADSERYDVTAKVEDAEAAREQSLSHDARLDRMKLRVQDLLARRFGLKLHHATKELSVLALTVAKNGSKLTEINTDALNAPERQVLMSSTKEGLKVLTLENAPLRFLTLMLSRQPEIDGRMLVDDTGLAGNYNLQLRWDPQNLSAASSATSEPSGGATLFAALQEQLGLKLESRKEAVDVVVIDHLDPLRKLVEVEIGSGSGRARRNAAFSCGAS